jgi:hypothetical protein
VESAVAAQTVAALVILTDQLTPVKPSSLTHSAVSRGFLREETGGMKTLIEKAREGTLSHLDKFALLAIIHDLYGDPSLEPACPPEMSAADKRRFLGDVQNDDTPLIEASLSEVKAHFARDTN